MKKPMRVAVTGARQIGYSLLFRIASGEMLARTAGDLQLLEIPDEKRKRRSRA